MSRRGSGKRASILRADDGEPSLARKALTALVLVALLFAAVIVQLTVVNRLPLPGGAAPDLVLLLVAAIAVFTGPLAGALAGFAGGLALDVAPPAIHYAGQYALVFCLAGWGAARANRVVRELRGERDQVTTFAVMAGAVAAGEAGKAALGMMLSDPDVTGAVASRLLPTAILYDLLVAPLVFWLVARITRGADAERAPAPEFSVEQRLALVFRSASAGAAPSLRLAGSGENYQRPRARRVPRLRLSGGRAGSSGTTGAAAPGTAVPVPGGRAARLSFGGDLPARTGQVGPGGRASRGPGKNWLRGAAGVALAGSPALRAQAAVAARRASRGPGRGWLTATGTAGPAEKRASRNLGKGWIRAGSLARPAGLGVSRGPGKGWLTAGSLAGSAEKRASRNLGKGWIRAGSLAGPAGKRRSRGPGRGWLRAAGPGAPGGLTAATAQDRPRSGAAALAARSAPSGLSALSGSGTPMSASSAPRRAPRRGWLAGTSRRPAAVLGSRPYGRPPAIRASAFRGTRAYHGSWYTAAPSGEWLRRSRHRWRKRGFLPGRRPPVPTGARPMAESAIVSAARRLGLFGGRW